MSFVAPTRPAALTLDAAGTLLHPAEPIAATYARVARSHGHVVEETELGARVRAAMHELAPLRSEDAGWHRYWRGVVARAIGADDPRVLAVLYEHYAEPAAWTISPGARECLRDLSACGISLCVVSNWDTRLRALLERLDLANGFAAIVVSGEVGLEKPDPRIFGLACTRLRTAPARVLHVGDHAEADVAGARAAGCQAVWFGHDVHDFGELSRVVLGSPANDG